MRVTLTPDTVSALEEVSGKKMTRNGDEIIREVAEIAENAETNDSIEMSVCDSTKREME